MIVPSRDLLPISSSYCDCCDLSGEVRMVCVTVTVSLRVSICRDEKCELVAGHLVLVLVPVCGSCSCCLKALGENGAVAACSVGWLGWAGLGWADRLQLQLFSPLLDVGPNTSPHWRLSSEPRTHKTQSHF